MIEAKLQIAVVGATGVVGRELLAGLQELGHPADKITALGSERTAGSELDYLDESVGVELATAESFRGIHLALFAVPEPVAARLAPAAQAAGAWVVDVSAAFRLREGVPLVVPGVNDGALDASFGGRIVSCPSALTASLLQVLEPLRQAFGLERVHLTGLLGASSRGHRGIEQLEKETSGLLSGKDAEEPFFPHRLGFNLIPQVGEFSQGWSSEELGWRSEAAKIWPGVGLRIDGTAILVPTFYGASAVVLLQTQKDASIEAVREALRSAPAVKVLDDPHEKVYPMPMLVTADPAVHVGRLRNLPGDPRWVTFFLSVDNAGRGSALNALDVAARLARRAV